jgi:putative endonuclease
MNRKEKGYFYERKTVDFLIEEGYEVLDTNYIGTHGEIDIIAKYENTIIFVEVKYRSNLNFGYGSESIDRKKSYRIYKTAREYIKEKRLHKYEIRFDSVCYLKEKREWTKNLMWGDEIGF